jgi:hypothetical protein
MGTHGSAARIRGLLAITGCLSNNESIRPYAAARIDPREAPDNTDPVPDNTSSS